jgi:hypothetical protein
VKLIHVLHRRSQGAGVPDGIRLIAFPVQPNTRFLSATFGAEIGRSRSGAASGLFFFGYLYT